MVKNPGTGTGSASRMSPFVAPTASVGRCWQSIEWMPLQPARSKGQNSNSFPAFRSFPLCYTAGRHEGVRRKATVELMTEPADRSVLLLQKVSELLLESRAITQQLEVVPDGESSADTADRNAHLSPDHARAAVERLAKVTSSGRTGTKTGTHSSTGDS